MPILLEPIHRSQVKCENFSRMRCSIWNWRSIRMCPRRYRQHSTSSYRHPLHVLRSYPGWFTSELFVLWGGNLQLARLRKKQSNNYRFAGDYQKPRLKNRCLIPMLRPSKNWPKIKPQNLSSTSSKPPDLEIFQQDTIPTYPITGGSEIGAKAKALEGPRSLSTPNFPKIANCLWWSFKIL